LREEMDDEQAKAEKGRVLDLRLDDKR